MRKYEVKGEWSGAMKLFFFFFGFFVAKDGGMKLKCQNRGKERSGR